MLGVSSVVFEKERGDKKIEHFHFGTAFQSIESGCDLERKGEKKT